jgi:hypothetical protein
MFSFLNPGILVALLAGTIPILIHLFAKKRPQRIIFSSIRFIKEIQKQQNKKINLKNLLILLMRILFILFVILGISRPALKLPFLKSSKKHPPTAIALIIDNSYSMNYLADDKTEFEKSLEITNNISDLLNENDKIVVITADKAWNELNSFPISGKIPKNILTSIKTSFNPLSYDELLKTANNKLHEIQFANSEIILISDYQKQEITYNPEFQTYWVSTSEIKSRNNLKINSVIPEIQIVNSELKHNISFEATNISEFDEENVLVRLFLNGRTVSEKAINLNKNQVINDKFSVELSEAGYYSGFVEVKNERWLDDNRYYFQFYFNPNPNIALLSATKEIPLQLETMLNILSGSNGLKIYHNLENLNYEALNQFDNVILYNPPKLDNQMRFLLDKFSERNRKISVFLSEDISNDWKIYYQQLFNLKFAGFESSKQRRIISDKFRKYNSIIDDENIRKLKVTDYWKTKTQSESILRTSSESLIIENKNNYLITMVPESKKNEFFLSPIYPVFMHLMLNDTGYRGINAEFETGDKIFSSEAMISNQNGESVKSDKNGFVAKFPGIYNIETDDLNYPAAVNISSDDSYYERVSLDDKIPSNISRVETDWENNILHTRYGFELWKYFFALALLCVIIELLLIKSEEKKQS